MSISFCISFQDKWIVFGGMLVTCIIMFLVVKYLTWYSWMKLVSISSGQVDSRTASGSTHSDWLLTSMLSAIIIHQIFCSHAIGLNTSCDWICPSQNWEISGDIPQRPVLKNIWRMINTIASIWLKRYAWIFVLGHYQFLGAHSFPQVSLSENCSLLGRDNARGQISEHIFAPNGVYCLYILQEVIWPPNKVTTPLRIKELC